MLITIQRFESLYDAQQTANLLAGYIQRALHKLLQKLDP